MENQSKALRLRIYISSTDKFKHAPLYEVIVYAAKRYGLLGATVLKGYMGFGASSAVHSQKLWELTEKLPIIVEIIDLPEKIEKFTNNILPYFDKIRNGFLITHDKTTIVVYKQGVKK